MEKLDPGQKLSGIPAAAEPEWANSALQSAVIKANQYAI